MFYPGRGHFYFTLWKPDTSISFFYMSSAIFYLSIAIVYTSSWLFYLSITLFNVSITIFYVNLEYYCINLYANVYFYTLLLGYVHCECVLFRKIYKGLYIYPSFEYMWWTTTPTCKPRRQRDRFCQSIINGSLTRDKIGVRVKLIPTLLANNNRQEWSSWLNLVKSRPIPWSAAMTLAPGWTYVS